MALKHLTQTPTSHIASSTAHIPSIRLISATPSATGLSSTEGSTSIRVFDDSMASSSPTPWESLPPLPPPVPQLKHSASKLLPKTSTTGLNAGANGGGVSAKRLIPKKSKLGLLGSIGVGNHHHQQSTNKDLSDVVRRVGAGNNAASQASSKLKGGFEIYVDPAGDPDMSDILVVKKQKSRAALDDMGWGPAKGGVLGEVTNQSGPPRKEKDGLLKVKADEERKWWSIGRGRKDSKEEKKAKEKENAASTAGPPPRSQTPDPFKAAKAQPEAQTRSRFNSLDAGMLLGLGKKKSKDVLSTTPTIHIAKPAPSPPPTIRVASTPAFTTTSGTARPSLSLSTNPQLQPQGQPKRLERIPTPNQATLAARSATPTSMFGGLLAPPASSAGGGGGLSVPGATNGQEGQGSIALRAMRSVKSLAKIGGWAQAGKGEEKAVKEKGTSKKEKKSKTSSGTVKKKDKKKDKVGEATLRGAPSISSFEAGALSSGSPAALKPPVASVGKKRSILGLGLPSSMRLPTMRQGSTASSVLAGGTVGPSFSASSSGPAPVSTSAAAPTTSASRLSVDSAIQMDGRRRVSVQSTGSSLRPVSITSTISGGSSAGSRISSVGSSVRWDEEGLERARSQRERDGVGRRDSGSSQVSSSNGNVGKDGRRTSRESTRRSAEGRKRTAICDVFPEIGGAVKGRRMSGSPEPERMYPIVTIEEATADGHGEDLDALIEEESGTEQEQEVKVEEAAATPMKKPRKRPVSEQLLGRSRPAAMHEDEDGVLSILSAATNDLAQLINNLDLEATPATPDMTPLRPSLSPFSSEPSTSISRSLSLDGSPLKNKSLNAASALKNKGVITERSSVASISSLRPYAHPRNHPTLRGKPSNSDIVLGKAAPAVQLPEKTSLAELRANLRSSRASTNSSSSLSVSTAPALVNIKERPQLPPSMKTYKRASTPGPEPEPAPVFQALMPPKPRHQQVVRAKLSPARLKDAFDDSDEEDEDERYGTVRAAPVKSGKPSEFTFGSPSAGGPSKRASTSVASPAASFKKQQREHTVPISREARRILGMSGTMGGSDVSAYRVEIDESDPDSDVPEELRYILKKDEADTIAYQGADMDVDGEEDEFEDEDDSSFTGRYRFGMVPDEDVTMDIEVPRGSSAGSPFLQFAFSTSSQVEIQQAQRLPVFRAQLITDTTAHDADIDDDGVTSSDENSTKQSFDFTGELAKLNESGASDRRSFVEQLENAFKTPAKVDLRVDFGMPLDAVPPVPALPSLKSSVFDTSASSSANADLSGSFESSVGVGRDAGGSELMDMQEPTNIMEESQSSGGSHQALSLSQLGNGDSGSRIMDTKQPSLDLPSLGSSTATIVKGLKLKASTSSAISAISNTSDGVLNRSFKFGGVSVHSASPSSERLPESPGMDVLDMFSIDEFSQEEVPVERKPMSLADVIPPPSHSQEISFSSSMLDEYEDSALRSLMARAVPVPQEEEADSTDQVQDNRLSRASFIPLTRPSSGVSFGGLDSFDEVRRGFEFHDYRPHFYTEATAAAGHISARNRSHRRAQDSVFSIASVSSYGRVIRDGAKDPFDYGVMPPVPPLPPMPSAMPSVRERSFEEDGSDSMSFEMSTQVDDTFSFLNHRPAARRRVDSDASSFYFNAAPARGHRRRESNMSVSSVSGAPPVSMFNNSRSFGHHRRTSSVTSASSMAVSYAHGGMGGRAIMARHRRDASLDSINSELSSMRNLGRPGLGDKMFDTDYAGPLAAIAGSPSQSISGQDLLSVDYPNRTSMSSFDYYDSILDNEGNYRHHRDSIAEEDYEDDDERRSSVCDSLFDQTGENPSSVSSGSVFGDDDSQSVHKGLLPPHQFRPLSVISFGSAHSPMKEDDTMISMLGGGHVRRLSIGSMINASPCVRMEKKSNHRRTARMVYQGLKHAEDVPALPNKPKTLELKPSIASTSSFQFGGDRMIKARHGLLERQSLEDNVLVAEGEDLSRSFHVPVFSRPSTARSRSSTCTSESSGRDTPPLSPSDGSSMSGGSFSSIDMSDVDVALANRTHPVSTLATARARTRDHGHGHRRRYSKAHMSRSSVYETIEEEMSSAPSSPSQSLCGSATKKLRMVGDDSTAVYVVGSDTESIHNPEECVWDDERGIVALRKFYTLKDEAQSTVTESQRVWRDTPFSLYAVQSFDPPRQLEGMKALLEHSVHNYVPLPAELRRMRSRKSSRPSPYPPTRFMPASMVPPVFERPAQPKTTTAFAEQANLAATSPVLREKNVNSLHLAPSLDAVKPMSPFVLKITEHSAKKPASNKGSNGPVRPRVPSAARRSALGWSKRSSGPKSSTDQKENSIGEGLSMTPGESLRLNRPRPRSRTPASQARPIRV